MNVWRLLGASLFCLTLSLGVGAYAQDKDKGKDDKSKQADKGKPDDKGKTPDKGKEPDKAAGAGAKLEWKAFDKAGDKFYQEMTTTTEQTMKVMQMEVKQKQSQTFWVEWTAEKKVGEDFVAKQKIIGVKMDIEIGGNKISYDSTAKEQAANPLTDFFKALVGAEFTLHIDPKKMEVTKIDGQQKFVEDLSKANPQLQPLLKAILSEKALKQMADPVFAAIPEGGTVPAKGEWKKESTLEMGPIGNYKTTYTYTYDAKDKKGDLATINVATALEYTPPPAKGGNEGLPFRITSGKLKSDKGAGKVIFDIAKGRIAASDLTLELSGDLTIDIAGMSTDVNLKQSQVSTLKTMDKNPLAK